jgi:hypothetical protein
LLETPVKRHVNYGDSEQRGTPDTCGLLSHDGTVHEMTVDRNQLLGTWALISASSTDPSGAQLEPPYGANPSGFLTYTEDGRVTALISYGGRRPLSIGAKGPALVEEQAEAFKTFLAYGGRYRLTGDKVVHSIEISSIQNYLNKELVRTVEFHGNRIVLSTAPIMVNGKLQAIELVWERLEPK